MAALPPTKPISAAVLFLLVQLLTAVAPPRLLPAAAAAMSEVADRASKSAVPEGEEAVTTLVAMADSSLVSLASSQPLPEDIISEIAFALRSSALLLQNPTSSAATFFIASLILPHIRQLTQERTTLLIPSDAAIAAASPLHILAAAALSPYHLRSIALLHMLPSNLSFSHLLLLPDGSLLPTLLGHHFRLPVSPSGASAPRSLLIGGATIVRPDICPPSLSHIVTCHGIDGILAAAAVSSHDATDVEEDPNYGTAPAPAPSPDGTDSSKAEGLPSATLKDGGLSGVPAPAPEASSATPFTIPALPPFISSFIVVFFFFF